MMSGSGESAMGRFPEKALTVLKRWWRKKKHCEAMDCPSFAFRTSASERSRLNLRWGLIPFRPTFSDEMESDLNRALLFPSLICYSKSKLSIFLEGLGKLLVDFFKSLGFLCFFVAIYVEKNLICIFLFIL